jgi:predicted chitinase
MPYKPLTKNGEKFIIDAINKNGDSIKGSYPFALGRSKEVADTIYVANSKFQNTPITDNSSLATALISWFNLYSEQYLLDSNIIAAQTYVESNFKLWEYSNSGDAFKSSAMGISQLYDNDIWGLFTSNGTEVDVPKNQDLFLDLKNLIFNNLVGDLTDVRNIIPYQHNSTPATNEIALGNRKQLFQNIMNNPESMILTQCRFMSEIGERNNNLASSSLFSYSTNGYIESKTYNEIINNASKLTLDVKPGMDYVNKIFKILGGKYKTDLIGFGKDYIYDETLNDQSNRNLSGTVVINQGSYDNLTVGYKGNFPKETVKTIIESLTKFGITNQYLQSGILSVISTEAGFVPKSEFSYSSTSNDRLRFIFTTRLSDLTESQLGLLKTDDVGFFDKVYGDRYGNTTAGDGFKYRGRGFNGITFKDIYRETGNLIGVDIVADPELLNTVQVASDAVAAYFKKYLKDAEKILIPSKYYGINKFSDVNDLILGSRIALQANVGWKKNLNTTIYPEVFRKQLSVVGTLHAIVIAV